MLQVRIIRQTSMAASRATLIQNNSARSQLVESQISVGFIVLVRAKVDDTIEPVPKGVGVVEPSVAVEVTLPGSNDILTQ